jgi:hypothetical protein
MDIRDTGQGRTKTASQALRGGTPETRRSQIQAAMYRKALRKNRTKGASQATSTLYAVAQMQAAMDIRDAGQRHTGTPPQALAGAPYGNTHRNPVQAAIDRRNTGQGRTRTPPQAPCRETAQYTP